MTCLYRLFALTNPTDILFTFPLIAFFLPLANCACQDLTLVTNSRLVLGTEKNLTASISAGDLDGDQDLDLVIANGRHWPQPNYLFFNHAKGRFNEQICLGRARQTSYVTRLGDLDDDGDLDIVVGNDMAPNRIFLNDGQGEFREGGSFGGISSVRNIRLVDLDQDGHLDILSVCRGRPNLFFLNNGKGKFEKGRPFGSGDDSTIDVAAGDFNRDGFIDLALANRDDQPNFILLNNGNQQFNRKVPIGKTNKQSRAIILEDFNSDGHLDVAVANIGSTNYLHINDTQGGFKQPIAFGEPTANSYALAAADMDQDNDLDLIVANVQQPNAVFLYNKAAIELTPIPFGEANSSTYGLVVGDFDRDGRSDIATANSSSPNRIFLNRPNKEINKN